MYSRYKEKRECTINQHICTYLGRYLPSSGLGRGAGQPLVLGTYVYFRHEVFILHNVRTVPLIHMYLGKLSKYLIVYRHIT